MLRVLQNRNFEDFETKMPRQETYTPRTVFVPAIFQ
jgi:hypothetical protein